jgi:chemotaxis-related protein WspD
MNPTDTVRKALQREVPEDYVREATLRYARPLQSQEHGERWVLVFRVGPEWLALPTALIDEVAEARPRHSLPQRRSCALEGIVNVRGELLACVSIQRLLAIEAAPATAARGGRLLVLRQRHHRLACPVEMVYGVVRYHERELQPPPATLNAAVAYTQALLPCPCGSAGLLDAERLLRALERSLA